MTGLYKCLGLSALLSFPHMGAATPPPSNAAESQQAPREVTLLVDEQYPPYTYKTGKDISGIYIDILQAADEAIPDYQLRFKAVPWERGKKFIETGEALGLVPPYYHGHDWPYMYPYSEPLHIETITIACNKAIFEEPRTSWPSDYLGLKFGNIEGYDGWESEKFWEMVESGQLSYDKVSGLKSSILFLANGRVDCILTEAYAFDTALDKLTVLGEVKGNHVEMKKGPAIKSDTARVGYSKAAIDSGDYPWIEDFRQKLDNQLYQMRQNGVVEQIIVDHQISDIEVYTNPFVVH